MIRETITTLTSVDRVLDAKERALNEKDGMLFREVVRAKQHGEGQRAAMLANELVQLRRGLQTVTGSRLAIFTLTQRLESTRDLQEFTSNLAPAVQLASTLQSQLTRAMPEASDTIMNSLAEMTNMMQEAGRLSGDSPNIELATLEAEKIIMEATSIAEEQTKSKFPEVPMDFKEAEEA
ncbi:MAG: hypothetical protein JRN39_00945 [Nitrososphaerota archaeon]|nr:hypothetical protein [Nitrososphaerota archaeon]MDG6938960.1 hypothetical protein [Nitrososphaerota archaeon]